MQRSEIKLTPFFASYFFMGGGFPFASLPPFLAEDGTPPPAEEADLTPSPAEETEEAPLESRSGKKSDPAVSWSGLRLRSETAASFSAEAILRYTIFRALLGKISLPQPMENSGEMGRLLGIIHPLVIPAKSLTGGI